MNNGEVDRVLDEILGTSIDVNPGKRTKHRFRDANPQHIQEAAKLKAEVKRQNRKNKRK